MRAEAIIWLISAGFIIAAILIILEVASDETNNEAPDNIPKVYWLQHNDSENQRYHYCPYCETRWENGDKFCAQCGAPNKHYDE